MFNLTISLNEDKETLNKKKSKIIFYFTSLEHLISLDIESIPASINVCTYEGILSSFKKLIIEILVKIQLTLNLKRYFT